jgi:membrane associated rhomboid family serine protease
MTAQTTGQIGTKSVALVAALIFLCTAIELVLQLADAGWIDVPRLRAQAYEAGGFWPGLLGNWRENYPFQKMLMFVTYGGLHAGFWHLALNMITLYILGRQVVDRVGNGRFLAIYVLSIFGGGLGFGLLSNSLNPMVGASGALFGLAGALLAWDDKDRRQRGDDRWPTLRAAFFLVALNAALYIALAGVLAWQAHLGGFLAGWIAALAIDRPNAEPIDP